jgi:hypothetical protein
VPPTGALYFSNRSLAASITGLGGRVPVKGQLTQRFNFSGLILVRMPRAATGVVACAVFVYSGEGQDCFTPSTAGAFVHRRRQFRYPWGRSTGADLSHTTGSRPPGRVGQVWVLKPNGKPSENM